MALPLLEHPAVLDLVIARHPGPMLALAVSLLWMVAELVSLPRARKQLDIPRGDWLTVGLGVVPVAGVIVSIAWLFFLPPARYHAGLIVPSLLLCLAGIGLRTWSKLVLGRFYTFAIDLTEGHRVLCAGPYRFVRHPLYLGTLLAVSGFALLTQSWATLWLLTVPTVLMYGLRLMKEDAYLIEQLGEEYREYARRTARLIPFVW